MDTVDFSLLVIILISFAIILLSETPLTKVLVALSLAIIIYFSKGC